ncbi:MAG TPA: EamA family transporter [Gemmatimonadota bacterium]|nr:EamA family transporter [Gemmatimonadota bacterium]
MSGPARLGLLVLLALIWGSTWLVIKIGLADLPPFLSAALRFALAAAILFFLARLRAVPLLGSRRAHLIFLGLGLTVYWVSYGVVYWGEQYLASGLTAVLFATNPLFTLLLAQGVLPAERVTPRKLLGVALGFLGVVLIYRADLAFTHPRAPIAAVIMLLSPLAAAVSTVAIKRWAGHVHPYNLTILPMGYGAAALFLTSILTEEMGDARWSAGAIGSVVYLAVLGSVIAFVAYYTLLRQIPVTTLNLLSYVFPVVAVGLGYLILDEVLPPLAVAGAVLIVAGIALATWRRRVAPAPEASARRSR